MSLSGDLAAYGLTLSGRGERLDIDRVAPGSWAATEGLIVGDRVTHVGRQSLDRLSVDTALEIIRGERPVVTELTVQSAGMAEPRTIQPARRSCPACSKPRWSETGSAICELRAFRRRRRRNLKARCSGSGLKACGLGARSARRSGRIVSGRCPDRRAVSAARRHCFDARPASRTDEDVHGTRTRRRWTCRWSCWWMEKRRALPEVLAGALKDHARATLVGMPTFGKDSIHGCFGSTKAGRFGSRWPGSLPGGKPFSGVGVTPHISEPRPRTDARLPVRSRSGACRPNACDALTS